MRCFVQTQLPASAEAVWAKVKLPATLLYVARGLLGFSGAQHFPPEWHEGEVVQTRLWFFHMLPAWWKHTLVAAEVDGGRHVIRSREHSGFYTWDHVIRVTPLAAGACRYSDEIEIHAGLLTVFIWLYANVFYRYRQMRWRRLVSLGPIRSEKNKKYEAHQ